MKKIGFRTYVVNSDEQYLEAARDYSRNPTLLAYRIDAAKVYPCLIVFKDRDDDDVNYLGAYKIPVAAINEAVKELDDATSSTG